MRQTLENRLRLVRSRATVRAWEYRQRNHAKGTWYRLRRLLADASVAYALTERAARELLAEGHRSEPVGEQMNVTRLRLESDQTFLEARTNRGGLTIPAQELAARLLHCGVCAVLFPASAMIFVVAYAARDGVRGRA